MYALIFFKQTDINLSFHSWDYETERDWEKINFLGDKCPEPLLPVRSNPWFPETGGGEVDQGTNGPQELEQEEPPPLPQPNSQESKIR